MAVDESLADLNNLPDPDILANEIIENVEAGLESLKHSPSAQPQSRCTPNTTAHLSRQPYQYLLTHPDNTYTSISSTLNTNKEMYLS